MGSHQQSKSTFCFSHLGKEFIATTGITNVLFKKSVCNEQSSFGQSPIQILLAPTADTADVDAEADTADEKMSRREATDAETDDAAYAAAATATTATTATTTRCCCCFYSPRLTL